MFYITHILLNIYSFIDNRSCSTLQRYCSTAYSDVHNRFLTLQRYCSTAYSNVYNRFLTLQRYCQAAYINQKTATTTATITITATSTAAYLSKFTQTKTYPSLRNAAYSLSVEWRLPTSTRIAQHHFFSVVSSLANKQAAYI